MMFVFDTVPFSTQPSINSKYLMATEICVGYTNEPRYNYVPVEEENINSMGLALAEKSFIKDWDINDTTQNDYWDSF